MKRFLLTLLLLLPVKAFSLSTILDNGDLLQSGQYELGAQMQFVTDYGDGGDSGLNIIGHVFLPLSTAWNLRLHAGSGDTDANIGGGVKWIPIPDLETQPAIGAIFEAEWVGESSYDFLLVRAAPLLSKTFRWEYGSMSPYTSLPIGLMYMLDDIDGADRTEITLQLNLGVKISFEAFEDFSVVSEVGLELKDAPTYFSIMGRFLL